MTADDFEALVARLERAAARNPHTYRRKVLLLAGLGYTYIAGVLLLALVALLSMSLLLAKAPLLGVKLLIVFGAFFWLVVRAMWVKLDPPSGHEVRRADAPELFALLDRLQHELNSHSRIHSVQISDSFNAGVLQVPRLGIFGWHRNYLVIGLPLMKALSREQLAAVLAHEIGHLAGGHARVGNWIYRLRLSWMRLAALLEQTGSRGRFLFRPFYAYYVPYFSAASLPLARGDEYEADRNSARLTSPAAAAAALTASEVMHSFLQARFWPDIHRKSDNHAQPQFSPFADMGLAMTSQLDEDGVKEWLAAAMARKTSVADSHPALTDRLQAIGEQPRIAPPAAGESADLLLGSSLARITATFDQHWQQRIAGPWEERHKHVQQSRVQLTALDARAVAADLTFEERVQRARLTEEVGAGEAAALEQFRQLHAEAPERAHIAYSLGVRLLHQGDDAGLALIEQAIRDDADAIAPGAAALRDYHARHGRKDEAARWHQRWSERNAQLAGAQSERNQVSTRDSFEPHGLAPADIETLRQQLASVSDVRKAWLVRKHLQQMPEHPLLVFGFTTEPWWLLSNARKMQATLQQVVEKLTLPESTTVICLDGKHSELGQKIKAVPGSRVR